MKLIVNEWVDSQARKRCEWPATPLRRVLVSSQADPLRSNN